jgi:hypothetical protein
MSGQPTSLSLALCDAVDGAPGSLRAIARAAGIPHTTLVRIRAGDIEATPATVERIAAALERWGETCKRRSFRLRQELYRTEREDGLAYSPLRGGNAPEDLLGAFNAWIDTRGIIVGPDRWTIERPPKVAGRPFAGEWLLGQLWNCTDALPSSISSALDLPRGSTYARAARKVKRRARQG